MEASRAARHLRCRGRAPGRSGAPRQPTSRGALLEIKDNRGIRNFELYTDVNLKGNKGKYYENRCILKIINKV